MKKYKRNWLERKLDEYNHTMELIRTSLPVAILIIQVIILMKILWFILFIILIADKLGFFLAILIFTFVTPLLWQRKDKFFVLLYSIGMTVFVFVFFTLVLQLKFPQGILENFIVRTFY